MTDSNDSGKVGKHAPDDAGFEAPKHFGLDDCAIILGAKTLPLEQHYF